MKWTYSTAGLALSFLAWVMLFTPNAKAQSIETITSDRDRFVAVSGSQCGESNRRGKEGPVNLSGEWTMPAFVDRATVYLSGWKAEYLDEDHHIRSIETDLYDIRKSGSRLSWKFTGMLEDKDRNDGYEVCYNFIALGWNRNWIDAIADHRDSNNILATNNLDSGALFVEVDRLIENDAFIGKTGAALLPRGKSIGWFNQSTSFPIACYNCPVDHHLLQYGYSLQQPLKIADAHFVPWLSQAILKDNRARRDVGSSEAASALVGNDVAINHSNLEIQVQRGDGFRGCIFQRADVETETVTVEGLTFNYALPILSGWHLYYSCDDDEHLAEMGVWLSNIQYDASSGRLTYDLSRVLRDKDGRPGSAFRPKVDILGIDVGGPYLLEDNSASGSPTEVTPNPVAPALPSFEQLLEQGNLQENAPRQLHRR